MFLFFTEHMLWVLKSTVSRDVSFEDQHVIRQHQWRIQRWFVGGWGSPEPHFETKLFHFHGEFSEKSGKNNKYSCKIIKSNPL